MSPDPLPPDESSLPSKDAETPADVPSAEELRRAMKAFKKRLKLARLDDDSGLGHGPMSSGHRSGIVSVAAPNQYPQAVWDELVRLGRLKYVGHGLYERPET